MACYIGCYVSFEESSCRSFMGCGRVVDLGAHINEPP